MLKESGTQRPPFPGGVGCGARVPSSPFPFFFPPPSARVDQLSGRDLASGRGAAGVDQLSRRDLASGRGAAGVDQLAGRDLASGRGGRGGRPAGPARLNHGGLHCVCVCVVCVCVVCVWCVSQAIDQVASFVFHEILLFHCRRCWWCSPPPPPPLLRFPLSGVRQSHSTVTLLPMPSPQGLFLSILYLFSPPRKEAKSSGKARRHI